MTIFKSQLSQDRWVREQFLLYQARLLQETEPYFVEIGAHDGVELSNSYYFEKHLGWNGLCVEPNPESFKKLILNRGCHCSSFAVSNKKGQLPINYDVPNPMLAGAAEGGTLTNCDTITKILEDYEAPRDITYMSIDVEGHEIEVLEGLDLEKFSPAIFTIEHNGDSGRISSLVQWLSSNGYLFRFFHWDIFAIKDWALWK